MAVENILLSKKKQLQKTINSIDQLQKDLQSQQDDYQKTVDYIKSFENKAFKPNITGMTNNVYITEKLDEASGTIKCMIANSSTVKKVASWVMVSKDGVYDSSGNLLKEIPVVEALSLFI